MQDAQLDTGADYFDQTVQKSPFSSVVTFMEQELRKIDRGRLFVYKQRDLMVGKLLQFGVLSEVTCQNIPRGYTIDQLERQLLRTRLVLNGESLLYSFSSSDMVVLDNKKNRFCGSAAMIGFPEAEVLVIIGFQASELPF